MSDKVELQRNLLLVSDELKGRKANILGTLSIPFKKKDAISLSRALFEIPDEIAKQVKELKGDAGVLINMDDFEDEYLVTFDVIKFIK